jgi:hypothetical protein
VRLGDEMNGFMAEENVATMEFAANPESPAW